MPIKQLIPISRQHPESPSGKKRKKIPWRSIAVTLAVILGCLGLAAALAISMALAWISRDLPDPNALITRDIPLATKIYDRSGQHLLYEIHGEENRTLVQVSDLPPYVGQATIAIEDKNFYNHRGISWRGLVRAFVVNVVKGERIKGTSTLTQQLVKNAILTNERTYTRKFKEVLMSLQLERVFSKDQILQMYLNEVPYGSTIYGIESAAHNYFSKPAKELTIDEAALLAALPQAPDTYSPYGTGSRGDNRDRLVARQQYIIELMAEQGYIKAEEAAEAKQVETLKKLVPRRISNIKAPHFVMYVRSLLIEEYGQSVVERKGMKVTTSLDWDKQLIAEEEVKKGVEERGKKFDFMNASLVSIDPKTGQILAMVGSKDFFDNENDGQVNVALRPRQPGSSFKPIVYAAGFIKGYTPDTVLWDVNTTFKTDLKNYEPKNYNFREHGPLTVRAALAGSLNIPAVKMLYLVGVGRVLDFAEQLGYTTFGDRSRFGLALVLGGGEVKLLEHANTYAAFADEGRQRPLAAILKVEDAAGKTLAEFKDPETKQVMDKSAALQITSILSDNNARAYIFGSRNNLTIPGRPVAAKTGTTNNFRDAWTMGYTPSLVAGVWVGNNDNTEMNRGADGSVVAAPIWQAYMRRALENTPVEQFPPAPANDTDKPVLINKSLETTLKIDKVTGKRATDLTPPELIEERVYREAHNILHYVDKDDPRGPAPRDPTQDPQYWNWEKAVQAYTEKTNWNTTSSPPTEYDDVHTESNIPSVSIDSPSQNTTLNSRTIDVAARVSATRRVTKVEVTSGGVLIGSKIGEPWYVQVRFPNSFEKGYHEITVTAYDDVANKGSASVTINLNAEQAPLQIRVTDPPNGSRLNIRDFPIKTTVDASEIKEVKKIDLYFQSSDGSIRLLSSEISPSSNFIQFEWKTPPSLGTYQLFATLEDADGAINTGQPITVTIEND